MSERRLQNELKIIKTILWNSAPWNLMEMTYSLGMGNSMMTPNFKSNFTKITHILHQKY